MPCYQPLTAYRAPYGEIVFDHSKSFRIKIELPCGRCIGCRLEKAKEWALRCYHEAQMHAENSFLTLTYAPEHLPGNHNLDHRDFQAFMKRLREHTGKKIRYYMCGEYGNKPNYRPHYHALLFGHEFDDKKLVNVRGQNRVYTSEKLDSLWKKGSCEIGSVTFKSAGYVARYIVKKCSDDPEELYNRYAIVDPETGEMTSRKLEYTKMSLKPGIGESWFRKYFKDLYPHDYAVLPDGRKTSVPKYYNKLLERENPKLHYELRQARIAKALVNPNNTPERLAVRERVRTKKAERLKREL